MGTIDPWGIETREKIYRTFVKGALADIRAWRKRKQYEEFARAVLAAGPGQLTVVPKGLDLRDVTPELLRKLDNPDWPDALRVENPDWPGWLAYMETGDRGCLLKGGRA